MYETESTSSQFEEQQGNHDDTKPMRAARRELMQRANKDSLLVELKLRKTKP